MPEGPEVKIASDFFNHFFKKSRTIRFQIITEYYHNKYDDIFKYLNKNLKIFQPSFCIGKNILLPIKDNLLLNIHLGMTGGWSRKLEKHCHFRIHEKSKELFFKDVRKFGKIKIISKKEIDDKYKKEFDMLNNDYDFKKHLNHLNKRISDKKSICAAIMDQKLFPGVGNYIKSETLYKSKIHPEKKWGSLTNNQKIDLIKNTKKIMVLSYKSGGAELRDFNNPFKKSDFQLMVYKRLRDNNNHIITSKITSDQRKSWICDKIQKL